MPERSLSLPLSAVQHWAYCPRQAGLILLDRVWDENLYTSQGARWHRRTHERGRQMEDGYELYRSMELWSDELRLHGYADAVELHSGVPVPIEHKRTGRHDADRQQLCAQALCLEEMYEASVDHGYLVDRTRHRRVRVSFDGKLRARTLQTIAELHAMLAEAVLPPPATDARCRNCSLIHSCLPQLTTGTKR